jgi:transcriptional regulator with XRE-family HTH domain
MAKAATKAATPSITAAGPDTADMQPRELSKHEFGRKLMALMLDKGWNQSELARRSKVGRDAVSTYIRGVSFPEPVNLQKLAVALGLTTEQLLPNVTIRGIASDPSPAFEIKQAAGGDPSRVWLRVNRIVSFDQAAAIVAILKETA